MNILLQIFKALSHEDEIGNEKSNDDRWRWTPTVAANVSRLTFHHDHKHCLIQTTTFEIRQALIGLQ